MIATLRPAGLQQPDGSTVAPAANRASREAVGARRRSGSRSDPGLAVALAWWNSRHAEVRVAMLRSLEDRGIPGTPAACWEAFGRGSYAQGWRPTLEQLAEAQAIVDAG